MQQKRCIVSLFFVTIILANTLIPLVADAIKVIKDNATRDDITAQLEDAAYMNIVVNTLRKCINGNKMVSIMTGRRGVKMKKGDIFENSQGIVIDDTAYSTSLSIENTVQGNGGDDGAIWCYQGTDGGNNIFQLFAKFLTDDKVGMTMEQILCDGNNSGLVARMDGKNCDSFSDDNSDEGSWCAIWDSPCYYWYGVDSDAALTHLQNVYNRFLTIVDNPYMPSWNEIGDYNNVDGYFLYILDYDFFCDSDKVDKGSSQSQPVVLIDREDKKITFTRNYYHVKTSKTWSNGISSDHPATSCTALLDRIEELRKNSNEVETRSGGYQGIITAELKRACKEAKDADGNNAWTTAKTKLEEIIADDDSSDELKSDAQTTLDELNDIITSDVYIKTEGISTALMIK